MKHLLEEVRQLMRLEEALRPRERDVLKAYVLTRSTGKAPNIPTRLAIKKTLERAGHRYPVPSARDVAQRQNWQVKRYRKSSDGRERGARYELRHLEGWYTLDMFARKLAPGQRPSLGKNASWWTVQVSWSASGLSRKRWETVYKSESPARDLARLRAFVEDCMGKVAARYAEEYKYYTQGEGLLRWLDRVAQRLLGLR